MERYWFRMFGECLLLVCLIFLLYSQTRILREEYALRHTLAHTLLDLQRVVQALEIYTEYHPTHRRFPPGPFLDLPGIELCPLKPPKPMLLSFLTTPVPYLKSVPIDPYVTQVDKGIPSTAVVLHWVQAHHVWDEEFFPYRHIGWGALSPGPSLRLPPNYEISILRRVPYETQPLQSILYHPSNGLRSVGILYYDTMGNRNELEQ